MPSGKLFFTKNFLMLISLYIGNIVYPLLTNQIFRSKLVSRRALRTTKQLAGMWQVSIFSASNFSLIIGLDSTEAKR